MSRAPSRVPAYFNRLIAAYRAGQAGRDVHLGYWDPPPPDGEPSRAGEFAAAQRRLTDRAVALSGVHPGDAVLDVGCGFGGTLEALAAVPELRLVGVNIDARQLALCSDIAAGGRLALVCADATALPFASNSFDSVLCIEAMFHFHDRRRFFSEAARLLQPGGSLLTTDILLQKPASDAPWDVATMAAALVRDFGPWPDLWSGRADLEAAAATKPLHLEHAEDWTAQTLRSYRFIAPEDFRLDPDGGSVMRWLHRSGYLRYVLQRFRRSAHAGA